MRRGGAKRGDKTLLDALIPAAEAAGNGAADGKNLRETALLAAKAAEAGAAETEKMMAVTGRAGYMGERTVGSRDPGAEVIALTLRAVSDYLCRAAD